MVKFRRGYRSRDVEYRASAGRGVRIGAGVGGAGVVGVVVTILIILLGGGGADLGGLGLDSGVSDIDAGGEPPPASPFLETVFDDVQNTWELIFEASDQTYPRSRMVIFTESVSTGGCGSASSEVGPFYCPADAMVYLDQAFFDELANRFGAPGDFARAYVVAHEVGHHVQNVLGISADVRAEQRSQPSLANQYSVRLELQADCLAGVWGFHAAGRAPTLSDGSGNILYLESGDLEEGLDAAAAVGDDRIQEAATGSSRPHTFTHGTAEQRVRWFGVGFEGGEPARCDTFGLEYDQL
jgi:predicted metalloprotease